MKQNVHHVVCLPMRKSIRAVICVLFDKGAGCRVSRLDRLLLIFHTNVYLQRGSGLYKKIYESSNYRTITIGDNPISLINESYHLAYIDDIDTMKYMIKDYCDDYMILSDRFRPVSLAFPLQKQSPYKDLFNE